MTTIILTGSNKYFSQTKDRTAGYFIDHGFHIFNVCKKYKELESDIAVEAAIKAIASPKLVYIVTNSFEFWEGKSVLLSPVSHIGTRSIMMIQFAFDHKIDVFLSSEINDMEDVQEKISAIASPESIVQQFK